MKKEEKKYISKIWKYYEKFSKKFPDIPPGDLHLIIRNLVKPKNWPKRFLLRKIGKEIYVP